MKTIFLFVVLSSLSIGSAIAAPANANLPSVTHYSIQLQLAPKEGNLEAIVTMTVTNTTAQPVSDLSFLLYRLLEVQKVSDDKGSLINFEQSIVRFGTSNLQANQIRFHLSEPLAPGAAIRVTINYRGSIFGYAEVMGYVNDRVSEQYSLVRPDALAYPMLAEPTFDSLRKAGVDVPFTYDLA